jgi:hypothetical protein
MCCHQLFFFISYDITLLLHAHSFLQREKSSSGESPPKRLSTDNPISAPPPTKRKRRTRKLSSSNESTTSEAPSNGSDLQNVLLATNIPGSPSPFVHSPPSIVVGGVSTIPSTSLLLSSTSSGGGIVGVGVGKEHFMKQEVVGGEGESDVVSKMHAEMLGAGPLSPMQVRDLFLHVHVQSINNCISFVCAFYKSMHACSISFVLNG